MNLKTFIEHFVEKNTLIRLWYKTTEGHELAFPNPIMEWGTWETRLENNTVTGVTDILCDSHPEAVNIVISHARV